MGKLKKIIYLFGTSQCGGTLFGLQLDSHSKIKDIGESRNALRGKMPFCIVCGKKCVHLSESFTNKQSVEFIHEVFAKKFNVEIIVDVSRSVEHFRFIVAHNPNVEFIPIFMYKNPFEYRISRVIRHAKSPKSISENIYQNIKEWLLAYDMVRGWIRDKSKYAIISYRDYAEYNDKYLRHLCKLIEVPYESAMHDYWAISHHYYGGNYSAQLSFNPAAHNKLKTTVSDVEYQSQKSMYMKKICYTSRQISCSDAQAILSNGRCSEIYRELEHLRLKPEMIL